MEHVLFFSSFLKAFFLEERNLINYVKVGNCVFMSHKTFLILVSIYVDGRVTQFCANFGDI